MPEQETALEEHLRLARAPVEQVAEPGWPGKSLGLPSPGGYREPKRMPWWLALIVWPVVWLGVVGWAALLLGFWAVDDDPGPRWYPEYGTGP